MSNIEYPDYKLVTSKGKIEIHVYALMILAGIEVSDERKRAINEGFKILADYIFGNNTLNKKMAMTALVIQEQHMLKWVFILSPVIFVTILSDLFKILLFFSYRK